MGSNYLLDPLTFVINTLFQLYISVVMLRFLLQWTRANFHNPISQFVVTATNPPLRPLRRIIPGIAGLDMASLVFMVALQFFALSLAAMLGGHGISPLFLLILSVAELVALGINVFIFAILVMVVMSWVNPGSYHPATDVLQSLTAPIMRPVRGLIPPFGGIDLSPMVALIGLQVLKMLVIPPIQQLALMAR